MESRGTNEALRLGFAEASALVRAGLHVRCLARHQSADTKRTHQKRHARRLATLPAPVDHNDLQEKLCRA
jgi:hypothetical protein